MSDIGGKLKLLLIMTIWGGVVYTAGLTSQAAGQVTGGVYRWVDENGTVHFSDRPLGAGAVPVAVEPLNTIRTSNQKAVATRQSGELKEAMRSLPQAPVGRRPASADYEISLAGAFQKSRDEVVLSGRVAGPECRTLRLDIDAVSQFGKRVRATTVVRDVGFGSRLFEVGVRATYDTRKTAPPRWEVADVRADCLN